MDPGASATAKSGLDSLKRTDELASVAQEVGDQGSEMERCGVVEVCLLLLCSVLCLYVWLIDYPWQSSCTFRAKKAMSMNTREIKGWEKSMMVSQRDLHEPALA